jgi:DHA2 family multidrug resistance protein-like MFS transporter
MAPVAGHLSDRYPPGLLGGIGLAALAAGMGLLAALPASPSVVDIGWRMAICGAGFGFFQAPNLRAIMTSAPPSRSGGASGIVATARLLGQTLGAALVAACFAVAEAHGPALALGLGGAFAGIASAVSFLRLAVPDEARGPA